MRVLGRPPYRNPLKIPIDVYLAPDSVLLPTGSRLNHSAGATVRSWGPPMAAPSPSVASPQALLLPVPFTLHPSSLCRVRHLLPNCSSGYGNGSPLSFPYSLLKVNFRMKKTCTASSTGLEPITAQTSPCSEPSVGPSASGPTRSSSHVASAGPCCPSGALLSIPLATSPEASCALSLSFKDLYENSLTQKSSSTFPCLSPIGLPSHPNFNVTSSRKSSPVPRARLVPFLWVFMTPGPLLGTLSPAPPTCSTVPGTSWALNDIS